MKRPELLDVVILLFDLDEFRLRRGIAGTVVEVYGDFEAYEVEFMDDDGDTVALLTLPPNAVRRATGAELQNLTHSDSPLKGDRAPVGDAMYLADRKPRPSSAR
jgi:hypothetical protein